MHKYIYLLVLLPFSAYAGSELEGLPHSCALIITEFRQTLDSIPETQADSDVKSTTPHDDFIIRVERAYKRFFVRVYGTKESPNYQAHSIPEKPDAVRETSKVLNLLAREAKIHIPVNLILQMEEADRALEENITLLRAREQTARLKLGSRYEAPEMVALQHVLQDGAALGRRGVLNRLAEFVRNNRGDYLAVRNYESLVDEWQSRLALILIGLINRDVIELQNPTFRSAVEELLVCSLRETTDPVSEKSLKTLETLVHQLNASTHQERPVSVEDGERILSAIENIRTWQSQLERVRHRFVMNYEAAQMLLGVLLSLTIPDGARQIDLHNQLRTLVWVPDLSKFRRLHEIVLNIVVKRGSFYHPSTRTLISRSDLEEIFSSGQLGSEGELVLAAQLLTNTEAMRDEFYRWQHYALEARLVHIREQCSEKIWAAIEQDAQTLAHSFGRQILQTPAVVAQIPKPFVDLILTTLEGGPNKSGGNSNKLLPGKVLPIPASLTRFLKTAVITIEPKQRATLETLITTTFESGNALHLPPQETLDESKPRKSKGYKPSEDFGKSSVYLGLYLQTLDRWAENYFDADHRAQAKYIAEGKVVPLDETNRLDSKRRNVLEAVLLLRRALTDCFISEDHTERDAETTLASQVHYFPTLSRIIVNDVTVPEISSLAERIACDLLRKLYDTSEEGRRALYGWVPFVQFAQRHAMGAAVHALIISAALGTWYFLPQEFKRVFSEPPAPEVKEARSEPEELEPSQVVPVIKPQVSKSKDREDFQKVESRQSKGAKELGEKTNAPKNIGAPSDPPTPLED